MNFTSSPAGLSGRITSSSVMSKRSQLPIVHGLSKATILPFGTTSMPTSICSFGSTFRCSRHFRDSSGAPGTVAAEVLRFVTETARHFARRFSHEIQSSGGVCRPITPAAPNSPSKPAHSQPFDSHRLKRFGNSFNETSLLHRAAVSFGLLIVLIELFGPVASPTAFGTASIRVA